jgi:site-specific DNA-methyltransferase (adenine-specific)
MTARDVIARKALWSAEKADCRAWLHSLPDDSIDLLITSPPFEDARTYGFRKRFPRGQAWVDWMHEVIAIAAPKVRGLIAVNCEGKTRGYRYSCVPQLLTADLHRAGFVLRKPPIFHRVGIPGSGGSDWLRNDYEPIVCVTREGRLPWSDNTACGHPPKFKPGGAMSYRNVDGVRKNARGYSGKSKRMKSGRPCHRLHTKRMPNGELKEQGYNAPDLANPGNTIQRLYTADEVAAFLAEASDVVHCKVGGGRMGHRLCHENEAPFPLTLAEFFVRSFCQPGGVVADCFLGSGTVAHAALIHGRRFVGCDARLSQVRLTSRRLAEVFPALAV